MEGMFVGLRFKGPRSKYTTNQIISIFICSRIDDSLLYKFSQNVLQKYVLRESGSICCVLDAFVETII